MNIDNKVHHDDENKDKAPVWDVSVHVRLPPHILFLTSLPSEEVKDKHKGSAAPQHKQA